MSTPQASPPCSPSPAAHSRSPGKASQTLLTLYGVVLRSCHHRQAACPSPCGAHPPQRAPAALSILLPVLAGLLAITAAAGEGPSAEGRKQLTLPLKFLTTPQWNAEGDSYSVRIEDPQHGQLTLRMVLTQVTGTSWTFSGEGTDYEITQPLPGEAFAPLVLAFKKRQLGEWDAGKLPALIEFCIAARYFHAALQELNAQPGLPAERRAGLLRQLRQGQARHLLERARELARAGQEAEAGRVLASLAGLLEADAGSDPAAYAARKRLEEAAGALQQELAAESAARKRWEDLVFKIKLALKGAEGPEAALIERLLPDLEGPLKAAQRQAILDQLHFGDAPQVDYAKALDALKRFSFAVRYGAALKPGEVPDLEAFFAAEADLGAYLDSPRLEEEGQSKAEELRLQKALAHRGLTDQVFEALVRWGGRVPPPPEPQAGEPRLGPLRLREAGEELAIPLEYLVVLPADYHPSQRRPVLIVLHGLRETAAEEALLWAPLATQRGWLVVAPELIVGREKGYLNTLEERQMVMRTLRDAARRFAVDPNRVYLAGHSMGAFLAWDVVLTYPDRFAGAAPFNGCATGAACYHLLNARVTPLYCVGSRREAAVAKVNSQSKELLGPYQALTYVEYNRPPTGGFREEFPAVLEWFERRQRVPHPAILEWVSGSTETPRVHWLELLDHKIVKAKENPNPRFQELLPGLRPAGVSRLSAEVKAGNQVILQAWQANSVRIYLPRELFDLRQPLRVSVNGKPAQPYAFQAGREHLLRIARHIGDRERLYWGSLDVPVKR